MNAKITGMTVQKKVGDAVQVQVNVQNIGGVAHEFWVVSWLGQEMGPVQPLSLDAGQTGSVSFAFTAGTAGAFDVAAAVFLEEALQTKLAEKVLPKEVVVEEAPVYAMEIVSIEVQ